MATSTFRLLASAMPEIADVCSKIQDPELRGRAFDVLVFEARQDGSTYSSNTATWATGTANLPASAYLGETRVDNGVGRG